MRCAEIGGNRHTGQELVELHQELEVDIVAVGRLAVRALDVVAVEIDTWKRVKPSSATWFKVCSRFGSSDLAARARRRQKDARREKTSEETADSLAHDSSPPTEAARFVGRRNNWGRESNVCLFRNFSPHSHTLAESGWLFTYPWRRWLSLRCSWRCDLLLRDGVVLRDPRQ